MGSYGSNLPHLPPEVMEKIVEHLDLADIKAFRLVCKETSQKAVGPRMKGYIQYQTTDLCEKSLLNLKQLAIHPAFGPAVHDLTIVSTIFDTSQVARMLKTATKTISEQNGMLTMTETHKLTEAELAEAQADFDFLEAKIAERHLFRPETVIDRLADLLKTFKKLESVKLDAKVVLGRETVITSGQGDWHRVWMGAAETFCIAMTAIARSKVAIERLYIYRDTPRCSVTSYEITTLLDKLEAEGFSEVGRSIKDFAVSFSTRVPIDFYRIDVARRELEVMGRAMGEAFGSTAGLYDADDEEAKAEENFTGIARLLKLMPNLQVFDLHMRNALKSAATSYDRIFTDISQHVILPDLHKMSIRGLRVTEPALLEFLENHPKVDDIDLSEITVTKPGSWQPILKTLFSNRTLKRLFLSDLWGGRLTNLDPVDSSMGAAKGQKWWTCQCSEADLVHTNEFTKEELDRGVELKTNPVGIMMGSIQASRWSRTRKALYGAP